MSDPYQVLTIRRQNGGRQIWIKGLRTTFAFFGWDQVYDEWEPNWHLGPNGTRFYYYGARTPRGNAGGQRLRICRSMSKDGHPRGLTNCFRIHSKASNMDLAELAHFAGPQVAWMESKCGKRVEWEDWEAYYQGKARPFHGARFRNVD